MPKFIVAEDVQNTLAFSLEQSDGGINLVATLLGEPSPTETYVLRINPSGTLVLYEGATGIGLVTDKDGKIVLVDKRED